MARRSADPLTPCDFDFQCVRASSQIVVGRLIASASRAPPVLGSCDSPEGLLGAHDAEQSELIATGTSLECEPSAVSELEARDGDAETVLSVRQ